MTDAELRLWHGLRGKQIQGHRFRRQVPIGNFFVDFACVKSKLIVEVDGSQHAVEAERDVARTAWLQSRGYRVIRFWNTDVLRELDGVLEAIRTALLISQEPGPHPDPARETQIAESASTTQCGIVDVESKAADAQHTPAISHRVRSSGRG
jgi:very-short-patch-repair endonuclease